MELISAIVVIAIAAGLWAVFLYRRRPLLGVAPTPAEIGEALQRSLAEFGTRAGLTEFLTKQGVTGDADIRGGMVYAPVDPTRLDPLAIRLRNAHAMRAQLRNPAACSLYLMDSEGNRPRLVDLDLEDIGEAASVMERVAADRRKSRALYRGMTEDEVTRLVRAGMSAFFKDDGEWGDANLAMQGQLDDTREFKIAREALELAFKVKGANV